jgi:hypothetical protein
MTSIIALIIGVLGVRAGSVWAGGNTAVRDPNNLSQIINRLWDDRMLPIEWLLSHDGVPGSGISNATLTTELTAAFNTWQALPASKMAFTFGGEVPFRDAGQAGPLGAGIDGRNLITFTDPDVTFPPGVLAVAITFTFTHDTVITNANNDLDGDGTPDIPNGTYPAGRIFDGDIAFNSGEQWSVSGVDSSIDVRAVALHEIGHVTGLSHSSIRDAVMWPFLDSNITAARTAKPDDIAYESFFYPSQPAFSNSFGAIRGAVTNGSNGAPILGAHVFTVDPLTGNSVVGAFSGDNGSYTIPGLAPGNYYVAIEPLDGDPVGLDPFRINEVVQFTFDTNFPEEFYDANESNVEPDPHAALAVTVTAGADHTGIDVITNTLEVPGVNRILQQGYNLFAYPVTVPSGLTAFDLLQALGAATEVNAIDRFTLGTSSFDRAQYLNGTAAGVDFPIRRGEGYVVHMDAQKVVSFAGGTDCPNLDLVRGLNLIGVACPPATYSAFNLLQDLGAPFEIEKVERFNPDTGTYETAQYDGAGHPSGVNFSVRNGEGYVVSMLAGKTGVKLPAPGSVFAPVITGLSPGRAVPGTIVVILGEGFAPDPTTDVVTFNGVGAGVIFATSTTLTVTVPNGATSGPVRVSIGGRLSNAVNFVVDSPTVAEIPGAELELISGQTADGTLSADGQQDRYVFTALAGSLVTIHAESVAPGVPDLVLLLEDPFGAVVATDDNGGGGTNPRIGNFELQNTGKHTVVVSNVPQSGTGAYRLSLTIATRSAPPQVSVLGGDFQTGLAGTTLPNPLSVFVTGATGAPVSGAKVTFVVTDGNIGASGLSPINAGTVVLSTNASGVVSVQTTLSATPGVYTITVTVDGAAPATFTVAATNKAVTSIVMNGDQQAGTVGAALPNPLEIILQDVNNNPVSGGLVAFLVAGGGGSVAPAGGQVTAANGKASTVFTLGQKITDAQIVAAFVPGAPKPLLFRATANAGSPAKARSNRSNFNRLTLGTARLNALQVQVLDQFDNPVKGALVNYAGPAGLAISPGLGPNGIFFTNFLTNDDGLHVAMVTAQSAKPTIDEFGNTGTAGLAARYAITATVAGGSSPTQTFNVDLDMGPTMVTASLQNDSALIGQPLANPVSKVVVRYERIDTFTDNNHDGKDDDNGDFRDENFNNLAQKGASNVTINFAVEREDGKKETDFGLQPTRTAAPSATTDGAGIASVGVTIGDVGGVNDVVGTIHGIPVVWHYADGTVLDQKTFVNGKNFAESTNLIAIPVVVTVTVNDTGAGIDFRTIQASLNGTSFFNGTTPPAVPPTFPEKLEVTADGAVLMALNQAIVDFSAFSQLKIEYRPSRPKLIAGANSVQVLKVKDHAINEQSNPTTLGFNFP